MTTETQEHLLALLRASREERSEAAEALLVSLDDNRDDEQIDQETWEREWAAELERRIAANKPGIPGEQVFAELREKLANRRKSE